MKRIRERRNSGFAGVAHTLTSMYVTPVDWQILCGTGKVAQTAYFFAVCDRPVKSQTPSCGICANLLYRPQQGTVKV
jgi:hypothetical protein